jgi:hypothetical protein
VSHPTPRPNLFGIPHRAIVPALLAVFFISGALSLRGDSVVFDETAHLPAGYTYLDQRDFRLNPEHPPLPKMWCALPLWLDGRNDGRADYRSAAWSGRPIQPGTTMTTKANQWQFGFEFINGPVASAERRDPASVLVPARLMMLTWGLLLGLIVFAWAREMWGSDGGLLALFLYCLSPTMLAHSRLVTTDLPIALAFTLTLWCLWRFMQQPDWLRGALVGLALAFALLVKFSALLLAPIVVLLLLLWAGWPGLFPSDRKARRNLTVYVLIGALVLGYAGVWAGYGFRYLATEDPTYQLDWEVIDLDGEGLAWRGIERVLDMKLLPQAYVYGLAYFLGGAARRLSYLNGEESLIGWWHYFPEAFAIKTPPALLLLIGLTLGLGIWRSRGRSFHGWYLALPVFVYLALSITSNLNIGHRHLAPIYPLLFVGIGALPSLMRPREDDDPWVDDATEERLEPLRRRWSRVRVGALGVLVAGHAFSFAAATPGYLSYFNVFAGGSDGGWRYLLDSNIDWGQDLARLPHVMRREGIDRVHLAYFGTGDPKAYGFDFVKTYVVNDFYTAERSGARPSSGEHIAVSLNLLQGLYYAKNNVFARTVVRAGWVPAERIQEWSDLRDRLSKEGERHPELPDWLVSRGFLTAEQVREVESGMLSGWLARLRDSQEPVAKAGDSIYIYRVP